MTNRVITFFEKIGDDLGKFFKSTTWEQKALATISYVEPFVEGILELADPAIAPLVGNVMSAVTTDLTTVKNIASAGAVAPGSTAAASVVAALGSIKSNLANLLADSGVKNSAKGAEITSVVTLVNGEVDALLGSAPMPAASA